MVSNYLLHLWMVCCCYTCERFATEELARVSERGSTATVVGCLTFQLLPIGVLLVDLSTLTCSHVERVIGACFCLGVCLLRSRAKRVVRA